MRVFYRTLSAVIWSCAIIMPGAVGAIELVGTFTQGGIIRGSAMPGSFVVLYGRKLRVSANGLFVFGFGHNAGKDADLLVITPSGERHKHKLSIASREYLIQNIEGLPDSMVTPDFKILDRIRKEALVVRKVRTRDSPLLYFLDPFQWPVSGTITGVYGSARILNGKARQPHFGIDIVATLGTLVRAPAAGVVTLADEDLFLSGGTVIMDHGHGVSSSFLHLSHILVSEGQLVIQGESIGMVGSTGRSTGPHLDWRMNWFEQRIDPQLLMGETKPK